ncbi:LysR family transcriptional regulator [Brenneria roseae subsp. americana]|uniref:LysR family transcriptional regulator n=1 Tax=Brenneria roseae subsp. americana TaxID=1508507 RepID=A0A2U1TW75_9GAMM|nr:LysR family transcriptional regulator [Brenneria roseae]PWC13602.1 LysR family transcriptional regulator [Brenneria roseae subsp. americana]
MTLIHYPLPKDLQVLVAVVNTGGFNSAAEALGQTPAFVTKRIQQLESSLGIKLLNRSSRGITLTESGKTCYEHALNILSDLQTLVDEVTQIKTLPAGPIRIGCSFGFGRSCIAPAITELMNLYPDLQIHFELFDRQIDLSRDNIDLDIRINDDIPDNYIARLLAQNKRILCAAPSYLAQQGTPAELGELARHDCLITKERDMTPGIWELEGTEGKKSVKISGHLSSNSGEIVLRWALEGKGIMLRSEWDVAPFLERGQLVQVLPGYAQSANIWAVYQTPLYGSVKLRVCVEFLTNYCRSHFSQGHAAHPIASGNKCTIRRTETGTA